MQSLLKLFQALTGGRPSSKIDITEAETTKKKESIKVPVTDKKNSNVTHNKKGQVPEKKIKVSHDNKIKKVKTQKSKTSKKDCFDSLDEQKGTSFFGNGDIDDMMEDCLMSRPETDRQLSYKGNTQTKLHSKQKKEKVEKVAPADHPCDTDKNTKAKDEPDISDAEKRRIHAVKAERANRRMRKRNLQYE